MTAHNPPGVTPVALPEGVDLQALEAAFLAELQEATPAPLPAPPRSLGFGTPRTAACRTRTAAPAPEVQR